MSIDSVMSGRVDFEAPLEAPDAAADVVEDLGVIGMNCTLRRWTVDSDP